MRKLFVALCAIMPGGFVLLAMLVVFAASACSHYSYRIQSGTAKLEGSGLTFSPGETAVHLAIAEDISASAGATRACSADPSRCQAKVLETAGPYGYGGYDLPYGFTVGAIGAAAAYEQRTAGKQQPSQREELLKERIKELEKNKRLQDKLLEKKGVKK